MNGLTRRQYLREKKRRLSVWRSDLLERNRALLNRLERLRVVAIYRPLFTYEQHQTLDRLEASLRSDRSDLATSNKRPLSEIRLEWIENNANRFHEQLAALETLLIPAPIPPQTLYTSGV